MSLPTTMREDEIARLIDENAALRAENERLRLAYNSLDPTLWYVTHRHGEHPAHTHSTLNTHSGNVVNANHEGVKTQTSAEFQAVYWAAQNAGTRDD